MEPHPARLTLSVIKAAIGSIGGHIAPSQALLDAVTHHMVQEGRDLVADLPLYLAFADPMNTPALILSPKMGQGFRFVIMDVSHTEVDRLERLAVLDRRFRVAGRPVSETTA